MWWRWKQNRHVYFGRELVLYWNCLFMICFLCMMRWFSRFFLLVISFHLSTVKKKKLFNYKVQKVTNLQQMGDDFCVLTASWHCDMLFVAKPKLFTTLTMQLFWPGNITTAINQTKHFLRREHFPNSDLPLFTEPSLSQRLISYKTRRPLMRADLFQSQLSSVNSSPTKRSFKSYLKSESFCKLPDNV